MNVRDGVERQLRQQLADLDTRYQEDLEENELLESLYRFQLAENAKLHAAHRRELELLQNDHLKSSWSRSSPHSIQHPLDQTVLSSTTHAVRR